MKSLLFTLLITSILLSSLKSACVPEQIRLTFGDLYFAAAGPKSLRLPSDHQNNNHAYLIWLAKEQCEFTVKVYDIRDSKKVISKPIAFKEEFTYDFSILQNITNPGVYHSISYTALLDEINFEHPYEYKIFDKNDKIVGGPFQFALASPTALTTKSKKVIFIGDHDIGAKGIKTLNRLKSEVSAHPNDYAAFYHLGDKSYNLNDENGIRGDKYFNALQDITAKLPFVSSPGNHEEYANWGFYNFRTRNPLWNNTKNHYFSFNLEGVHFISLNFNFYEDSDHATKQKMYNWLKKDLEQANNPENRALWPWIVIANHKPIYCMYNNVETREARRCYSYYGDMKIWDELFHKYSVNLMIAGHLHSYERMGPIYKNQSASFTPEKNDNTHHTISDPSGTVYIIEGVGGKEGHPTPEYHAQGYGYFMDRDPGFGTLYTVKEKSGILRLVYEHYNSETGKMIDYLNLVNTTMSLKPKNNNKFIYMLLAGILFAIIVLVLTANGVKYYKKKKEDKQAAKLPTAFKMKPTRFKEDAGIDMVDIPI